MIGCKCRFTVEGLNLERFLRRAGEDGVVIDHLRRKGKRINGLAHEKDIPLLQECAAQGGWKFTTKGFIGLKRHLNLIKQHWWLATAGAILFMLMILSLQLVWQVRITGAVVYQADAARFLSDNGIHAFVWKRSVDPDTVRDMLEWRYPDVAWVDCGWRGATLSIDLVQGVPQKETRSITGAGDVVASRAGIVDSIVTLAGTPVVQAGDIVQAGQLLISGYERSGNEENVPVMARGKVLARVWEQAEVSMPITEEATTYTGEETELWNVTCPWFPLWTNDTDIYEMQDRTLRIYSLGGLFFPLNLHRTIYAESETYSQVRSLEVTKEEAREAAFRLLKKNSEIHDELVDKWVDYCMIDDEVLYAVAYGEYLTDIAQPRRNIQ